MSEPTDDFPERTSREADAPLEAEQWRKRTEQYRALNAKLLARLRGRDRRIERLELAIARTVVMHHVWSSHLERKLERSPLTGAGDQRHVGDQRHGSDRATAAGQHAGGVTVHLPHLTRTLQALFDVMHEHWSERNPERTPKSSTVARAIDEKLGLKPQANGEASRSAQTFAAALRPDSVIESDGRHR